MTPEQARKEERDAIVDWLRETQKELRKNAGRGDIGPLVLKHHLESTEWTIEAIQRGDHREQQ